LSERSPIASWRRLAALLAAAALVCASIGELAHRAVVQHVACEHGELLELPAPSSGDVQPLTTSVSSASARTHHHCALDGFHAPGIQRSIVSVRARSHESRVAVLVAAQRERRPLTYAPKTSPPV